MKEERPTTDEFGMPLDSDKQKLLDELEDDAVASPQHRRAAEQYFEGFETIPVKINGKEKYVRKYAGTVYQRQLTKEQDRTNRITYAVLLALAFASLIGSSCLPTKSNSCWYVVIFSVISFIFYVIVLWYMYAYLTASRDMTVYEYKHGAQPLFKSTRIAAYSVLAPILSVLLMMIFRKEPFTFMEGVRAVMLAASALCIYTIGEIEKNVTYEEKKASELPNDIFA